MKKEPKIHEEYSDADISIRSGDLVLVRESLEGSPTVKAKVVCIIEAEDGVYVDIDPVDVLENASQIDKKLLMKGSCVKLDKMKKL